MSKSRQLTAKKLKADLVKVWLGDFPDSEKEDGIKALDCFCKQLLLEYMFECEIELYSKKEVDKEVMDIDKFLKDNL